MRYSVGILDDAQRDHDKILKWISERSQHGASAWAQAFDHVLANLEVNPTRCPLAVENDSVEFEVREVRFKTRQGRPYRALFTIRGDTVIILHVRGPGQDFVSSEEVRSIE